MWPFERQRKLDPPSADVLLQRRIIQLHGMRGALYSGENSIGTRSAGGT